MFKNLSASYCISPKQAKIPRKACFPWFFSVSLKTSFNLEFLGKKFVHPKVLSRYFWAYLTVISLLVFSRCNKKEEEVLSENHFWTIQNPPGGVSVFHKFQIFAICKPLVSFHIRTKWINSVC